MDALANIGFLRVVPTDEIHQATKEIKLSLKWNKAIKHLSFFRKSPTESIVTFDIIFDATAPTNGEQIKIIVLNWERMPQVLHLLFINALQVLEEGCDSVIILHSLTLIDANSFIKIATISE